MPCCTSGDACMGLASVTRQRQTGSWLCLQAEEDYEAALAARRAEMEAELLRKDLEQLQLLSEHARPESIASLPSESEEILPSTEGKQQPTLHLRIHWGTS